MEKQPKRITLRFSDEVHSKLELTAKLLGLDINGLLNLIIRIELGPFKALLLTDDDMRIIGAARRKKGDAPRIDCTLRVSEELKRILVQMSRCYADGVNRLVNEMIKRGLPRFWLDATVYGDFALPDTYTLTYSNWLKANPKGSVDEFDQELRHYIDGEKTSLKRLIYEKETCE